LMFGLVRGVVLVLILVALAGLTELPKEEFWRNALLRPYAVEGVRAMKPLLPEALAAYVHVDGPDAPSNAQQDSGVHRLP
jgi:membrane protein required for colicin V production